LTRELLTAFALILVLEGIAYALFPEIVKRLAAHTLRMPAQSLRVGGLAAAIVGVIIVWILRR
jgi:uncharacterized protein